MRHLPLALLAVTAACQPSSQALPVPEPSAEAAPTTTAAPPAAARAAKPPLVLPERFTAVGTEPFWAAQVDGARLTYTTPEDQVGQAIAIARRGERDLVELRGNLDGKPLALTVSPGPCSDGMSDTVYPFAVVRRWGEDEQHGCARTQPQSQPGEKP